MPKAYPILTWFLIALLALMPMLNGCDQSSGQEPTKTSPSGAGNAPAPAATYAKPSPDELYQLVAPIALFPDNLVAQVLAASTYPDQVATANTWLKQNTKLKGDDLTKAIDKQPWDVSVKGLTQFPDVVNQMASNLSWTSALGDAYFNIPQDVMNAVQVMRQRASQAGNLKSNAQQKVTTEPATPPQAQASSSQQPTVVQAPAQTIVVQPAQPQVVYVPSYNPTVVYGTPVAVYPGYAPPPPPPSTGEVVAAGLISFGIGMAVGAAMSNSWGWNSWGCGWHNSTVVYNRNVYVSNSNTFVNRNNYYNRNVNNVNRNNINTNNINRDNVNNYRANNFNNTTHNSNVTTPNFGTEHNQSQFRNTNSGGENRQQLGQAQDRPQMNQQNRPEMSQNQSGPELNQAQRGYGAQEAGTRSDAFSGYGQGGNERVNSARGQESLSRNGSRASASSGRTAHAPGGGSHRR